MEKTLVKTLKALAEYLDLSLGDLLEGITLHALRREAAFQQAGRSATSERCGTIYGLDLTARDSHRLVEEDHDWLTNGAISSLISNQAESIRPVSPP